MNIAIIGTGMGHNCPGLCFMRWGLMSHVDVNREKINIACWREYPDCLRPGLEDGIA